VSSTPDGAVHPSREEFARLGPEHRVVPVTRRLLADGETPVGVYRKLAGNRAGTFLLESAEHGRVWSQYSFVGVRCAATLTERDGAAIWVGEAPPFASAHDGGDPLAALRDTAERLRTPRTPGLPPFTGGLVGYIGYDAVRRLERLPSTAPDDLGMPELAMMLVSDMAVLDHSDGTPAYESINPFALREPIAPHIAAREEGVEISLAPIADAFARLSAAADCIVVEGVGGWCAPLSESLMQCDMAKALRLPVILVVGLRLGCLNHAILGARAIPADVCALLGWIGSRVHLAMQPVRENIETLRERLPAPCLGILPYSKDRDARRAGAHLRDAATALSDACLPAPL